MKERMRADGRWASEHAEGDETDCGSEHVRGEAEMKVELRWPAWMKRETAACYTDLSPAAIDQYGKRGLLPQPHKVGEALLRISPERFDFRMPVLRRLGRLGASLNGSGYGGA